MRIDLIDKPCTFHYEDKDGNSIPFDLQQGFPGKGWHAQFSKSLLVHESICFNDDGKDLLPVKFAKWLINMGKQLLRKMPDSWKKTGGSMSFNSTINSAWPIVKYLKEKRGFTFHDACVVASELCDHCGSIIEWELADQDPNSPANQAYLKTCRSHCKNCKTIDPEYFIRRRMWACYRTLKLEGDIGKAYKEISANAAEGYWDKARCDPPIK